MNTLEQIKNKFSDKILKWEEHNPKRIYFEIKPSDIKEIAGFLFDGINLRFVTASGVDTREGIEILYHFSDDSAGMMVSLRTLITDKKNPEIDSLTTFRKAMHWMEREIHELLGVNFIGNPNLKHLLLNDNWPKGDYPLRHDVTNKE